MSFKAPKSLFAVIATDALLSLVAEAFVMISFFWFYRLLGTEFGSDGVGQYSLMRRVLAILIPIGLIGLSEAMGRFIARAADEAGRRQVIVAGAVIAFFSTGIVVIGLTTNVHVSARWLFGAETYAPLVQPFAVLFTGLTAHTFAYSCLRGRLRIRDANVLQIINLGIFPILLMTAGAGLGFREIVLALGLGTLLIALLLLLATTIPVAIRPGLTNMGREILGFGASRLIGTLAVAAILSVPSMVAVHYISIDEVGYISLSIALLIGIGGISFPLGAVLLPHVSHLVAKGEKERFGASLHVLVGAILQIFVFVCGQFVVFSDYVLELWMGPAFAPASGITAAIFLALPAYAFHAILKNVIDALTVKGTNSVNALITLVLLLTGLIIAVMVVSHERIALTFSCIFSLTYGILAGLTYRSVGELLSHKHAQNFRHLVWSIGLTVLAMLISGYFRQVVTSSLWAFLLFQSSLCIAYGFLLWWLGFPWIKVIEQRILGRT